MVKFFILVAFAVIILTVVFELIPSNSFSNYSKVICGIVTSLIVFQVIFNSDVNFTVSDALKESVTTPAAAQNIALNQSIKIIKSRICEELYNFYGKEFDVDIEINNSNIEKLYVYSYSEINENELKECINKICGLKTERIYIKYR